MRQLGYTFLSRVAQGVRMARPLRKRIQSPKAMGTLAWGTANKLVFGAG